MAEAGLRAHLARMRRFAGAALREAAATMVQRGATAVAEAARDAAGEGTLADGILIASTGAASAEVRSTAPHAAVMEFGTSRTPGRPHLRPAAARQRGSIAADAARAVHSVARGG